MIILLPKVRRDFAMASERRAAWQDGPRGSVSAAQLAALGDVWRDCVEDIPHYGELVRTGQAPERIGRWSELLSIPPLSRRAIQEHPELFIRRSVPPPDFIKTAGSTGTPLKIGVTQGERDLMRIVKLAAWQEFGYSESSRLFLIWGHSHLLGTGWRGIVNHRRRKLADWLLGYRRVDAYRLNEELCLRHARELIRFRPHGLIGYASALDLFARYTSSLRPEFRRLKLGFVLATSEMAPKPDTFALLSDLFDCPVIQEYGGAEFGQVALFPGSDSFRVYGDLNYVECGGPASPEDGSYPILVTSLYPRYLPLVRYEVGDAVVNPEVLENGHVQSFSGLAGRVNDVVQIGTTDFIHSVSIFHCIHQEPSVYNIQMVVSDDGIEIRLVSDPDGRASVEARIRERLAQVHPLLRSAKVTYQDDVETSKAGKRRWFIDLRSTTRDSREIGADGYR